MVCPYSGMLLSLKKEAVLLSVKAWMNLEGIMLNEIVAAAESLQSCLTLCDPIDGSHQAPPSLGFSRQEHWSGFPFPSPMQESEK